MARSIKFRGWDGEKQRMWSWSELMDTHPLGCLYSHGDGSWEVMQYTGLLDRNRTEIYEGDIVRFMYNSTPQKECVGIVKWDERDLSFTFAGLLIEPTPRKTMEVIGNIYENADLLANTVSE